MKTEKPKSISEYIAGLPSKAQKHMEQIRALIKKIVPEAEETISYGMPAFNLNGHYLIYFGGYRDFVSLYPAPRENPAFKEEIAAYAGGKGTIRFPLKKGLPQRLIKKIIQFRLRENVNKVRNKAKSSIMKKTSATEYIHYHKDGSIWAKGKMTEGIPDGYWQWFRKDGTLMRSGYFSRGKQSGEWTTYDKKGQVYKVTHMK